MNAALAMLAAVLSATAAAQEQKSEPPPIIVENERPAGEAPLTDLAREMAGHPRARRPLARFEQPLCLMVAATDVELARTIAERTIENAKAAKVPVGKKGCRPNALLNLSDDAHAQLVAIRKSGRRLFAGLSPREIDAAMGARDPVYVFQASRVSAASGEVIIDTPEAAGPNGTPGPANRVYSMGRLKREIREDMLAALVVIDAKAVTDLSPHQIADYASLRLLAPTGEVDAREAGAPRTIMTLFVNPATAPAAMTRFDRAYLKALYRMPMGAFASEVLRAAVLDVVRGTPDDDG